MSREDVEDLIVDTLDDLISEMAANAVGAVCLDDLERAVVSLRNRIMQRRADWE